MDDMVLIEVDKQGRNQTFLIMEQSKNELGIVQITIAPVYRGEQAQAQHIRLEEGHLDKMRTWLNKYFDG